MNVGLTPYIAELSFGLLPDGLSGKNRVLLIALDKQYLTDYSVEVLHSTLYRKDLK